MIRILRQDTLRGHRSPLKKHGSTRHNGHVCGLHVRAQGEYHFGAESIAVSGPYLCIVVAGEEDGNDLVGDFELHYVEFTGLDLSLRQDRVIWPSGNGNHHRLSHLRSLHADECTEAESLFADLAELSINPDPSAEVAAVARVLCLLSIWLRPIKIGKRDRLHQFRDGIRDAALDARISLEQLAQCVGGNQDHLRECFTTVFGQTPHEYRSQMRLLHARTALAHSEQSIADIATMVGLSREAFSRAFRRRFGLTPTAFRADRGHAH